MVKAWSKNNLREIRHTLGRYLAIVGIVALGVGFFAGLKVAKPAMLQTGEQYLERTRMFDYRLISTLGLTAEDAEYFASLPYVADAEGAFSADVLATAQERELALKALSLPERVNLVTLKEGRMPEQPNECLADAARFSSADIGTTFALREGGDGFTITEMTIVGLCSTPLYLNIDRGTTSLGGGTLSGFVLLPRTAFTQEYDTEIYLTLTDTDRTLYSEAYDARVEQVKPLLEQELDRRVELRYQNIVGQAREELEKARKEYEDGEAEYRRERAQAEQELAEAKQALEDGQREISANRARLNMAEQELEEAKQTLEDGKKSYEDGLKELETQKAEVYAQLDAAQAEIDENRAVTDSAMQQIDDSGVLVQYEALLVTRRQIETAMQTLDPNSAEYLLYRDMLAAADLIIEQVQQSEFYTQYQELLSAIAQLDAAQAELDAQRAAADAQFAQAQAELDAAAQEIADGQEQIAQSEAEIANGWVALSAAEQTLSEGQAEYDDAYAQAQTQFAEAERELAEGARKLDEAELEVERIEHPTAYTLSRDTNTGYITFQNDASIVEGVAEVLPLFFFLVAAFVCITTMTRMLDEHRTQIGTLKALGYSDGKIAWKYNSYSGSAALLGSVIGFFGGTWLFPQAIWKAYSMLYNFAPLEYVFDWELALWSLGAAMLSTVGATWLTCRAELRRMPSELMRPRAPKAGKRILLERVPILWNRFPFLYKVSIRNIMRYKKRLFMMLLGIGGCTALIATGLGVRDSIAHVADDQFDDILRYDIAVTFSVPMDAAKQERFLSDLEGEDARCVFLETGAFQVRKDNAVCTVNVIATDDAAIADAVDLHYRGAAVEYPQQGVVIDACLAETLGLDVGDALPISLDETREVEAEIVGLCENHVYHYAYMTAQTYETLLGTPCEYETAYLLTDGDPYALGAKLASVARVASVNVLDSLRGMVDNMMLSLNYIIMVVVFSACALAFIVLYNLSNISITERAREIATVKVLGFYPRETQSYVFREILLLTIAGAAVGLPAGKLLHAFVMEQISIEMVSFEVRIAPLSYVLAFSITVVLVLFVYLFLMHKIDRIDMAESLKSVE